MSTRISFAELAAAGITLQPAEAVAIVVEVCRQRIAGDLPGIPSADLIRITRDGAIAVEAMGPEDEADIPRAARLLDGLLPGFDAPSAAYRVSGALRLAIARALGTLDLPRYATLEEFRAALSRFAVPDPVATARSLFLAWEAQQTAPPLVVADPVKTPVPARGSQVVTGADYESATRGSWLTHARRIAVPLGAAALVVMALTLAPRARPAKGPAEQRRVQVKTSAPVGVREASAPPSAVEPPSTPSPSRELPERAAVPPVARVPQHERQVDTPRLIQALAYSPAFARSGSAVYFHQQEGGTSALKRGDTDPLGRIVEVTSIVDDRALNFHPRPSPDGSQIAFDSDRDGVRAVFVAEADGRNPRRISGGGYAAVPSWSPDGRQVAFVRAEPGHARVWNLWIANADGSRLRRLTHHAVGQAWGGSWFPDGRRIAYSVETRLIVLDVVTGAKQTFDSPRPGHLVRTPAVSPQGDRIIFQVHHEGTWLMDAATGSMHPVLNDPSAEEYTWAPDGRTVAFHSHRAGSWGVWVMAP